MSQDGPMVVSAPRWAVAAAPCRRQSVGALAVESVERGAQVVAVARRVEAEVEAEWTAHLGEEATARLGAALERLRDITDPHL